MIIRQEESTPIGNYFHDSGATTLFNAISSSVDEFEVDTEQLSVWCDRMVALVKGLQGLVKKIEKEEIKKLHEQEIDDRINRSAQ